MKSTSCAYFVLPFARKANARFFRDVIAKLHLSKDHLFLDLGNDRSNISIIIRPMIHAMNTFIDVSFVISSNYNNPSDIPKTVIYCDNIDEGLQMIDFLTTLLKPEHRQLGLIRPFNATHSHAYRSNVMETFRKGTVPIIVSTELFGMGCNIPDIARSIMWKRPPSVSSFVQRAGRAARGPGTKGIAVLLVEPSVYQAKQATRRKQSTKRARKPAATATLQNSSSSEDEHPDTFDRLIAKAPNASCRRRTIACIFGHQHQALCPTVACCDVCSLWLLDLAKPRKTTKGKKSRATGPVRGVTRPLVQIGLRKWRDRMLATHHPHAIYASSVILPDSLIDFLASVGPINTEENLNRYMEGEGWYWWGKHGKHLFQFLSRVNAIPQFEPLPPKQQREKRPFNSVAEEIFSAESQSSTCVESRSEVNGMAPKSAPGVSQPALATCPTPSAKRQRLCNNIATSAPPDRHSHTDRLINSLPPPAPSTPRPPVPLPSQHFLLTPAPTPSVRNTAPPTSRSRFPSDNHPNASDYLREFQAFCAQQPPPSSPWPAQAPHATSSDRHIRGPAHAYPTPSRPNPPDYS